MEDIFSLKKILKILKLLLLYRLIEKRKKKVKERKFNECVQTNRISLEGSISL